MGEIFFVFFIFTFRDLYFLVCFCSNYFRIYDLGEYDVYELNYKKSQLFSKLILLLVYFAGLVDDQFG